MKPILIGVCGGSGSGKSTLIKRLASEFKGNVTLLNMDSFYKPQPDTTYEQRTKTNYDHPDSLDKDVMIKCIRDLSEGKDTLIPVYDFTIHNRSYKPWETVEAKELVIIDGILLFAFPEIVEMLSLKIFVDADDDVRILRRLLRDGRERARSPESVVEQYLTTVKPIYELYVAPHKKDADIVVPEGGKNEGALRLICDALKYRLSQEAE